MEKSRQSGIELLRILAACGIIFMHYPNYANGYDVLSNQLFMKMLWAIMVCSVDLFVMISGFFLCMSTKRTVGKISNLWFVMWTIAIVSYIIRAIIQSEPVSVLHFGRIVLPPCDYFVILYSVLYLISPYVNLVMNRMIPRDRNVMMIIMLCVFSVYPGITNIYQSFIGETVVGVDTIGAWGHQHGMNIVNWILCYLVGAWLRLNEIPSKIKSSFSGLVTFLCAALTFAFSYLTELTGFDYGSPFLIIESAALIVIFSKMQFQSKFVNSLAKAAFVAYPMQFQLFHFLKINEYANEKLWVLALHILVTFIIIYIASWIVWRILEWVLRPIVKYLNKIEIPYFS